MGEGSNSLTTGSSIMSLASLALAVPTGGASLGATALSLGSTGLGVASSLISAQGKASGDEFQAAELDRQAEYGDLKATQTNAQMTRNLAISLGNIDAVRAAARTDPTSPTGAAVRDFTEQVGTEQKNIKVDSIMAQAQEDEANAAYLRKASSDALLSGDISAGSVLLKGLSGLPGRGGGGGGGVPGQPLNILPPGL